MNCEPLNKKLAVKHRLQYGSEDNIRAQLSLAERKHAQTGGDVSKMVVSEWKAILAEYIANQSGGETRAIDPRNATNNAGLTTYESTVLQDNLMSITNNPDLANRAGTEGGFTFKFSPILGMLMSAVPFYHYHAIIYHKLIQGFRVLLTDVVEYNAEKDEYTADLDNLYPLSLTEDAQTVVASPKGGFLLTPDGNGGVQIRWIKRDATTPDFDLDLEKYCSENGFFELSAYAVAMNVAIDWSKYRSVSNLCDGYAKSTGTLHVPRYTSFGANNSEHRISFNFMAPRIVETNSPLRNTKLGDFASLAGKVMNKKSDWVNNKYLYPMFNETAFFTFEEDKFTSYVNDKLVKHMPNEKFLTSYPFYKDDNKAVFGVDVVVEDSALAKGQIVQNYPGSYGSWVLTPGVSW